MRWERLSDFYVSQAWREFRRALIAERTNPRDGILYSEYSGKPIASGYDVVLHHKQPLTAQNVNDYSVSLNPDNIQIVTHREHNEIHSRFGFATERKVYVVWGAPCSGKSTFVKSIKGNSDIVVDIDMLWYALTGEKYYKPQALLKNVFELRKCLTDMIKTRYPRQGWERCWYIAGLPHRAERERLCADLGAEDIFIEATKEECLQRLAADKEREPYAEQWTAYINEWFALYLP